MADPVTIMMVGSTLLSAGGDVAAGDAAAMAGKYEAQQLQQQADARYAQATRQAYEEGRAGERVISDARAAMAAGGGGVDIEHLADIGAEADYRALSALYEGETEATGIRQQAKARKWAGKTKQKESRMKALSTVLSGGSNIYDSFKAGKTKQKESRMKALSGGSNIYDSFKAD